MKLPVWVLALGSTLLVQSAASFMNQCLPVVAPLLTASTGLAPQRIGNLTSLGSVGTVLFLLFGSAILARLGPVRSLQLGAGISVLALLIAASGLWPALVLAALMLGVGYGPTPPAGSRILAATAPAGHRTLIFSIKQAGAPAGGALAGLIVAPIAVRFGWQPALLVTIIVGSVSAAVINPLREMMDAERDRRRSLHPRDILHWRNVLAPFAAVRGDALLLSVTALTVSFSIVQGTLFSFTVTYLTQRGMTLESAGLAYACMQSAGVFARVLLGWLADRTGQPAVNLTAQAYVAGACVCAYAFMPMDAPFATVALVATACGFFGASWNGIAMAEIARLSPPDQIVEATSGSTMFTFLGYAAGPSLFALAVPLFGWRVPYAIVGIQVALMAVAQTFILWRRSARRGGG